MSLAPQVCKGWLVGSKNRSGFLSVLSEEVPNVIKSGKFEEEIVPVTIPQRKGDTIVIKQDEFPRFGSTYESLSKLRPAFKKEGSVTAGNASGVNDGAAAVVVMSKEKADALGLTALATISSWASAGVDPLIMGTGPIPASRKALDKGV